jgi:two-component system cell cycle response regulator CtrA
MRVLIAEMDDNLARSMELALKASGQTVFTTDLGAEAIDLAKIYEYDLIVLNLDLPDMTGLDVLRRIRAAKIASPVMIISTTTDIDAKVRMFAAGADDYLGIPLALDELIARGDAIIRRSKGHAQSLLEIGALSLDTRAKGLQVNGKPIHLTGKEYGMLELLALRKGNVLTKEVFLNHLYGGMDEPEIKIIDVFICKLRKKLKLAGAGDCIETVWGRGYVLREVPAPVQPEAANDGSAEHRAWHENAA